MDVTSFKNVYGSGIVHRNSGVSWNIPEIIKKNERMQAGQFEDSVGSNGMKKIFYNIGFIMKQTLYRQTDKDVTDFILKARSDVAELGSPFFRSMFLSYFEDSHFENVINRDRGSLLDGHILNQCIGNTSYPVNLANVVRDWSEPDLEKSGLILKSFPSNDELLSHKDDWDNWDKVEQVMNMVDVSANNQDIKSANASGTGGKIVVLEHWKEDWFELGGEMKFTKGCVKYLDASPIQPQEADDADSSNWQAHYELERFVSPKTRKIESVKELKELRKRGIIGETEDRIPCYPFKERRFFTLPGRALGVGVWELIAGIQEHYNESWFDKRKFDRLANRGLLVLKTSGDNDSPVSQEFLNNVDTGSILEIDQTEDLQHFRMGSITNEHIVIVDKLFELARQTMGITGSLIVEPKATQSATSASIEQQNASTTYADILEGLSLYYEELFRDFLIPAIIEELSERKAIRLAGNRKELDEIIDILAENLVNSSIAANPPMTDSNTIPDEELKKAKEAVKIMQPRGKSRFAQFKKSIFALFDFDVQFYAGNAEYDPARQIAIYDRILNYALSGQTEYSATRIIDSIIMTLNQDPEEFKKSQEEIKAEQEAMEAQQEAEMQAEMAKNGAVPVEPQQEGIKRQPNLKIG